MIEALMVFGSLAYCHIAHGSNLVPIVRGSTIFSRAGKMPATEDKEKGERTGQKNHNGNRLGPR